MRWPRMATLVLGLLWFGDWALAQSRPSTPRIIHFTQSAREDGFVALLGQLPQPGVYRIPAGTQVTVEGLITTTGGLPPETSPSLRLIRKSRPDQRVYYRPDGATALESGDVIVAEKQESHLHERPTGEPPSGVQLALLGVMDRPIVVRVKPQQATIGNICNMLGQRPELASQVKVLAAGRIDRFDQPIPDGSLLVFAPRSINPGLLPEFPAIRELPTTTSVAVENGPSNSHNPNNSHNIVPTGLFTSSSPTTADANEANLRQAEIGVGRMDPLPAPQWGGSQLEVPRLPGGEQYAPYPPGSNSPSAMTDPRSQSNAQYVQRGPRGVVEDVPPPPGTMAQSPPVQTTPFPQVSPQTGMNVSSGLRLPTGPAFSTGGMGSTRPTEATMASRSGLPSSTPAGLDAGFSAPPYTGPTRVELPTPAGLVPSIPDAPEPPTFDDGAQTTSTGWFGGSFLTMAAVLGSVVGLMGAAFVVGRFVDPQAGFQPIGRLSSAATSETPAGHSAAPSLSRFVEAPPARSGDQYPAHGWSELDPDDLQQPFRSSSMEAPRTITLPVATSRETLGETTSRDQQLPMSVERMIEDLLHQRLEIVEEPAFINRQLRFQELPGDKRFARIDPPEPVLTAASGQMPHFLPASRQPVMGDRPVDRRDEPTGERIPQRAGQPRGAMADLARKPTFRRVDDAQNAITGERISAQSHSTGEGAPAPFERALVQLRGAKQS